MSRQLSTKIVFDLMGGACTLKALALCAEGGIRFSYGMHFIEDHGLPIWEIPPSTLGGGQWC